MMSLEGFTPECKECGNELKIYEAEYCLHCIEQRWYRKIPDIVDKAFKFMSKNGDKNEAPKKRS